MKKNAVLMLLLFLAVFTVSLSAQGMDDDKLMFKQYRLPADATPDSVLTEIDSVMYQDGKVFTGTAYSRFANGQLQHVSTYLNGLKQGTTYVWYPDGKPQLIATYRNGYLSGRFKGWYQFGAVIYDLVLSESKLSGDQMYEADTARETSSGEDSEKTGDANEGGND